MPEHTIIPRNPDMGKAYDNSTLIAEPINNFPEYHKWLYKNIGYGVPRPQVELTGRLMADNRLAFKSIFGKPTFYFRGTHYFHCWYVHMPTCDLIISTAREHGTCYEVVTTHPLLGKIRKNIPAALAFMDALAKELPKRF